MQKSPVLITEMTMLKAKTKKQGSNPRIDIVDKKRGVNETIPDYDDLFPARGRVSAIATCTSRMRRDETDMCIAVQ